MTTRTVNDVTIVDVFGYLDTLTSGQASEEMTRLAKGKNKVLVNLENLAFLGSAGIRVLLRTSLTLRKSGGKLKLCNATGGAKKVIELCALDTFLDFYDSESMALAAF